MNQLLLTSLISSYSNVFSPELNSINFVENNVNISWNKDAFTGLSNVNLFLLHNDFIPEYDNGTDILNKNIPNTGYYDWIPEYGLNKYIDSKETFKILISSNNDPFSTTIGESITNMMSGDFFINSNVNITSPVSSTILYSQNITVINLNGFKNNLTCYLSTNSSAIIDTFKIDAGIDVFEYNVNSNVQYYNNYNLSLRIVEDNTNINRTVNNLLSAGINIQNENFDIIGDTILNITWTNNNYYGSNRVVLRNSSFYTYFDLLTNDNFIELNLSESYCEDLYFLSVFSTDMKLDSVVNINKIITTTTTATTTPTTTATTTPTTPTTPTTTITTANISTTDFVPVNEEERTIFILAAFGIFVILVILLSWYYLRDKKKKRKESKVHPSPKPPAPSNNLPPIRNNFYPELPQSDDDITNVYIPFNKNNRNVHNDIYQETGTIHEDRPILNNFTYGNPEPSSSSNYVKAETLFISDHEYDEPENFDGTSTFQSQPIEPPKIIPRKSNTNQTRRKSSRSKKRSSRKQKSNEKRPWRPPSPNPVKEDYREVERRRTRRRSRTKSLVSNEIHEYNVLDIDDDQRRSKDSNNEYHNLNRKNSDNSTNYQSRISYSDNRTSYSDNRTSYSDHRKSVQLSSPLYSELDNVHYATPNNFAYITKKDREIQKQLERETEYV